MKRSPNISSHPSFLQSPKRTQFLDEELFVGLLDQGTPSDQESALVSVRQATRSDNSDLRIAMCTLTLLSCLRPMILSSKPSLQTNAIAIVLNLSLEPPNRTCIVKSGILNLLVGLLKYGAGTEVRGLVVAVIHSLSVEEENCATIGALGVVPALVEVFSGRDEVNMARRDAGMAIYYLTFLADNRGRVIKTNGAVRRIVGVVKNDREDKIKSAGIRIACNLARCEDGRSALMEADGVAVMVSLIQSSLGKKTNNGFVPERQNHTEDMEYMAAAAIYGISKGKSSRFHGMAKLAKAEEILSWVLEERNGAIREMARRTLKAIRGDREIEEQNE